MKFLLSRVPQLRPLIANAIRRICGNAPKHRFTTSGEYWESRYAKGGTSGAGSYNELAEFKSEVLNRFVQEREIRDVIEFGCGDGNQLELSNYPRYLGIDVSASAIATCRSRFANDPTKHFLLLSDYAGQRAQLSLSLDVVYHLVEDSTFEDYMKKLFDAATNYVVIYSSNMESSPEDQVPHVRHRLHTQWVDTHRSDWELESKISNRYPFNPETKEGSFADFYVYQRRRR